MRYLKRNEKFGIALPKNVKEALQQDKENGNTMWADAIATEMKNVKVAFKILDDGEMAPCDLGTKTVHSHYKPTTRNL